MNRLHVVCVLVGLVGFSSQAQQAQQAQGVSKNAPTREGQRARQAERQQYPTENAPLPIRVVESPSDEADRKRREADAAKHEDADLKAQVRSADAAEKQVVVGVATVVLSVFGFFALIWTLCETRRSVFAANRAACAAELAVTNAKDSAEKQLRAYVGVMKAYAIWSPDEDDAMRLVSIVVDFKNTGQTPAGKMTCWVASRSSKELPIEFNALLLKEPDSVGLLWPGQISHMRIERDLVLGQEHEISIWRKGAEALYLWGEIKYLDGFSDEARTTTFRYVMPKDGVDADGGRFRPCAEGNNFT